MGIRSKDMANMLAREIIDSCLNYSIVMDNDAIVGKLIDSVPVQEIKLVLLKKKAKRINIQ